MQLAANFHDARIDVFDVSFGPVPSAGMFTDPTLPVGYAPFNRFAAHGVLDSPWGMTIAPANFGQFSGDLLIGNFGDGRIHAFDQSTGERLGFLRAG